MSNLKNKIKNFIPQKYNRSYVRMLRLPKKSTLFLTYNIDLIKLILELKIKLDILRSKLSLPLSLVSSVNLKTEGGHESYFQYVARINEFAVIVLKEEKLEMSFGERERYSYQITCLAQLISNLFYLERQMSDICLFDKDIPKVKEMFYFCINTLLINNLFSKIEGIDK